MAYGLTKRIFKHALGEGWIKPGDVVIDCFGGIGSTGIVGASLGLRVVCVELEEKFRRLAGSYDCPGITKQEWVRWFNRFGRNQDICPNCQANAQSWYEKDYIIPSRKPHHFVGNFELNSKAFEVNHFGHCYQPQIIRGDSRKLSEVIAGADVIPAMPKPINSVEIGKPNTGLEAMKPGSVDAIISSPPYAETLKGDGTQSETAAESRAKRVTAGGSLGQSQRTQGYGSKGNLGNLKAGSVDAVVSSPPFAEAQKGGGISAAMRGNGDYGLTTRLPGSCYQPSEHGKTPGNLGNLKPGEVDSIISSPPYEGNDQRGGHTKVASEKRVATHGYGETNGNIGNDKGETFWAAAHQIVSECHKILKPGGQPVEDGENIIFCDCRK